MSKITINNASIGWICPKCGRVYSPNMPVCCYCNIEPYTNKHYNNISIYYSNTPIDEKEAEANNTNNKSHENSWCENEL